MYNNVVILRKDLLEISAIHKNKMKIINIPEKTQLVDKGYDHDGNRIYAFHVYVQGKLCLFTTRHITPDMFIVPLSSTHPLK
jgi:hypothetical protein